MVVIKIFGDHNSKTLVTENSIRLALLTTFAPINAMSIASFLQQNVKNMRDKGSNGFRPILVEHFNLNRELKRLPLKANSQKSSFGSLV